jgi:hypothetical protein
MGVVLDRRVAFHSVVHLYCCQHAACTYGVCSMPILTLQRTHTCVTRSLKTADPYPCGTLDVYASG